MLWQTLVWRAPFDLRVLHIIPVRMVRRTWMVSLAPAALKQLGWKGPLMG